MKDEGQESMADQVVREIIKESKDQKDANQVSTLNRYEQNIATGEATSTEEKGQSGQLVLSKRLEMNLAESTKMGTIRATSLRKLIRPKWHRPYKLYRVIVGHHGWVRCLAVSPCNTYFASGSADRTIKFWDMASGELKISLTGHINSIRGL